MRSWMSDAGRGTSRVDSQRRPGAPWWGWTPITSGFGTRATTSPARAGWRGPPRRCRFGTAPVDGRDEPVLRRGGPETVQEIARVTRRRLVLGLLNRNSLLWREKGEDPIGARTRGPGGIARRSLRASLGGRSWPWCATCGSRRVWPRRAASPAGHVRVHPPHHVPPMLLQPSAELRPHTRVERLLDPTVRRLGGSSQRFRAFRRRGHHAGVK